jgi:hypothetical protein
VVHFPVHFRLYFCTTLTSLSIRHKVFGNPLLAAKFGILRKNGGFFHKSMIEVPAVMHHESASWRRMLITQPPLRLMSAEMFKPSGRLSMTQRHQHLGDYRYLCELHRIGIRMDQTYRGLLDWRGRPYFMVTIDGIDMWEDRWEGRKSLEEIDGTGKKGTNRTSGEWQRVASRLPQLEFQPRAGCTRTKWTLQIRNALQWNSSGANEEVMSRLQSIDEDGFWTRPS